MSGCPYLRKQILICGNKCDEQPALPNCPQCPTGGTGSFVCKNSLIDINSTLDTEDAFTIADDKAYFNIPKLGFHKKCSKPVVTDGKYILTFNELNIYNIDLEVYPTGCCGQNLPINYEVITSPASLDISSVIVGTNRIDLSGSFPSGTQLAFYTDPNLLKYFKCITLVGQIEVTDAACINRNINEITGAMKVAYISNRPPTVSLLPPIPTPAPGVAPTLPDQYPESNSVWPWTEAIIPWMKNQPFPGPPATITPPDAVPAGPPYVNGYADAYAKFRSIPDTVLLYLGYDATKASPTQEDWTLFLRNFEDRGYGGTGGQATWEIVNYAKKQYMNALSVDKLQFYQDKIESFANTSYSEIVQNKLPFASTFQRNVILFFLSMHIGQLDYPEFVVEYFSDFMTFIGIANSNDPRQNPIVMKGYNNAGRVFEYIDEKAQIAIANEDKSTLVYWWNQAGLGTKALLFESVHNINAFSQFSNVLYSVVLATINPTNPLNPALPPYPNFLQLYASAATDNDRLNVVRELYRIISPNSNSFSNFNPETPTSKNIEARHIHQQIMIQNMPGAPNTALQTFAYFTYNPAQYNANFASNLAGIDGLTPSNDFLTNLPVSPIDTETVVDASRPIIPIFNRPTYAPFGLGYRRCAGEIFVYLVTEVLLDTFSKATLGFESRAGNFPTIYVGPFKGVPDNIFAKQPF